MIKEEKITGLVKWFSSRRRYGFIERDDGKKDVFVHQNDARGVWLSEGDRVRFFVVQAPKGPRAFGVEQVSNPTHRPKRIMEPRSVSDMAASDTATMNSSYSYTVYPKRH